MKQQKRQQNWHHGVQVIMLIGLAVLITAGTGCGLTGWKHRSKKAEKEAACAAMQNRVQRRYFVVPRGPVDVTGRPGGFAEEITAALNSEPNCTAILLPVNFPLDAPPELPPGPSPQFYQLVESMGPSAAIDEILIVQVNEAAAFRPMRISAVLERRAVGEGIILDRQHRTWNAPVDDEPLSPSKFNRFILSHPPALGRVEHHELSRLSPMTFQRNIAQQVALELAVMPL